MPASQELELSLDVTFDEHFTTATAYTWKPFRDSMLLRPTSSDCLLPSGECSGDALDLACLEEEMNTAEPSTFPVMLNELVQDNQDENMEQEKETVPELSMEFEIDEEQLELDELSIYDDPTLRRSKRRKREPDRYVAGFMAQLAPICGGELVKAFVTEVFETGNIDCKGSNTTPFMPPPNNIYCVQKILDNRVRNSWLKSYLRELKNLIQNDTFNPDEELRPGEPVIPILDDNRVKILEDGLLDKLKTRFVVRGDLQKKYMPDEETWAPTPTHPALKVFIAVCVLHKQNMWQLDFIGAFLQSPMKSRVFVKLPAILGELFPEYKKYCGKPIMLNKSMYGQTVSGAYWFDELNTWLVEEEKFVQSIIAPTLYTKTFEDGSTIWLLNYVDDMLYFCTSESRRREFEKHVCKRFAVELKGRAQWYISMKLRQLNNYDIVIDQDRYVQSLLQRFLNTVRMPILDKKTSTPIPTDFVYSKDDLAETEDASKILQRKYNIDFRALIGCLLYLTYTRIDIVYSINKLAKATHRPGEYHLKCAVHLLCYLRDNATYGLRFHANWEKSRIYNILKENNIPTSTEFAGFSDSSWQDCPDSGRSTGGYITTYRGTPIAFSSNVPSPVALSSAEAEYNEACLACMNLAHIKMLVEDMIGKKFAEPLPMLLDNKSAVDMGKTFKTTKHTRHISRRYHYVKEGENNGDHCLHWVEGDKYMIADFLTKPGIKKNFREATLEVQEDTSKLSKLKEE